MWCSDVRLCGHFLVGPVPYDIVLGLDWLTEHKVVWSFHSDKLRAYVYGRWCYPTLPRTKKKKPRIENFPAARLRTPAEQAYDILAKQIEDMSLDEPRAFLRPLPKRYKTPPRARNKVKIDTLLQWAKENTHDFSHPLHGMYNILALPVGRILTDEGQGALYYALFETSPTSVRQATSELINDVEKYPWPTASLEHTRFDEWMESEIARATPHQTLDVLRVYCAVFPYKLP